MMDCSLALILKVTPVPNLGLRWVCLKGHGPFKWADLIDSELPDRRGKCPECNKGGYRDSMVIPATSYQAAAEASDKPKQGKLL